MIRTEEVQALLSHGGTVVGENDDKIGKIGQIFLDDETSEPEWVTVKTGMFGGAESFIPLQNARVHDNEIHVGFDKNTVKDAPRVENSEGHLSQDEEAELYRYYGMEYTESQSDSGLPAGAADTHDQRESRDDLASAPETVGHDTSGPTTDTAMTRSEEQLHVGTEQVSTGKAKLRKYVVTENVSTTVPVSHEEVRIEREPITDANRGDATSGGELTTEEHEVELSAERVVVDKEVVPVERVRMDKAVVTEDQQVDEKIRKERIDTDTDGDVNLDGTTDSGR